MKISLFTEVYRPIINGVVTSVENLATQLRALGHEVYTFAPHIPKSSDADAPVFRMPSLPLPARTDYRLTLPLVARRNKANVLSHCDVIHSHSLFVTRWMAQYYARSRFRMPLVYTYHTLLEDYAHYSPLGRRLTTQLTRELTRNYANSADAVTVPTAAVAQRLRDMGVTAPICTIPTGIDLEPFKHPGPVAAAELLAQQGIAPDAPVVLLVSRLAREKGIQTLLEAMAEVVRRVPEARLLLVGSGPEEGFLRQRVRALGLESHCAFAGPVERRQLPAYYSVARVFAFPSTTETQGLVLAEAFASGLPVVAIETPQTREVFGTHLAGELVSDAAGMAYAIERLLVDSDRRAAAGNHARAAATAFDIRATAARTLAVYEAVVAGHKGGELPEEALALFEPV